MANEVQFKLTIDGTPYPIDDVEFLLQTTAYPGGHKYELRLTGDNILKHFSSLEPGVHIIPDKPRSRDLILSVNSVRAKFLESTKTGKYIFFLNTISEVMSTDGDVVLAGECSLVAGKDTAKN
jgi:hypothetical protein